MLVFDELKMLGWRDSPGVFTAHGYVIGPGVEKTEWVVKDPFYYFIGMRGTRYFYVVKKDSAIYMDYLPKIPSKDIEQYLREKACSM